MFTTINNNKCKKICTLDTIHVKKRHNTDYGMFREPSLVASLFYASRTVSDIQFRHPCIRCSLLPSFCHGWNTAMLCW